MHEMQARTRSIAGTLIHFMKVFYPVIAGTIRICKNMARPTIADAKEAERLLM